MDDNQTAAPAGDGAQPVSDNTPLDLDAAVSILGADDEKQDRPREPNGQFTKTQDGDGGPPVDGANDDPAGEAEPAADEAERPDGEPSEPEPEPPTEGYAKSEDKVRLRDGTEVTVAELKKGREEAPELKRQLAETEARVRKEIEPLLAQTQQKSNVLDEILPLSVEVLKAQLPDEADDALWATDPIEAGQRDRQHRVAKARLEQLQNAQKARAAEQQQARADAVKAFVHEQQGLLLETRPQLRDPKNAEAFYRDYVVAPAKSVGFTEAEINNTYDHRLILLAEKAAKWDRYEAEAKAARPKVAEKSKDAVPVQAPARRASPSERTAAEVEAYDKELRRTGSLESALKILNAINR